MTDEPAYGGPPRGTRDLRVDPEKCPGWITGAERTPAAGERVYTHEGTAVVVRVLGKTSTGGCLIELSMEDGRKAPFFAAAGNIMVEPEGGAVAPSSV